MEEEEEQSDCVRNARGVETADDSDRSVVDMLAANILVVDIQLTAADVHWSSDLADMQPPHALQPIDDFYWLRARRPVPDAS